MLVDLGEPVVSDRRRKKESGPRRPGGRPPPKADELRTRRINIDVSEKEWTTLTERSEAVRLGLRRYMREAALGRTLTPAAVPPSAADLDAAAILTRVAADLARLAEATTAGLVATISAELLRDLYDAAHLLGLRLIGAVPRAR